MDHECLCKMMRTQRSTQLSQTSQEIIGPHPGRKCVIISAPQEDDAGLSPWSVISHNNNTSGAGVAISFTEAVGSNGVLTSATFFETAGAGVVSALQYISGGFTITLAQFTTTGTWTGSVTLQPGDKVQWNVITPIGASTADFGLFGSQGVIPSRITLSFIGAAVADQGLDLYPGQAPLYLTYDKIGAAIEEAITAIAVTGTPTVTVLDVFSSQLDKLAAQAAYK